MNALLLPVSLSLSMHAYNPYLTQAYYIRCCQAERPSSNWWKLKFSNIVCQRRLHFLCFSIVNLKLHSKVIVTLKRFTCDRIKKRFMVADKMVYYTLLHFDLPMEYMETYHIKHKICMTIYETKSDLCVPMCQTDYNHLSLVNLIFIANSYWLLFTWSATNLIGVVI